MRGECAVRVKLYVRSPTHKYAGAWCLLSDYGKTPEEISAELLVEVACSTALKVEQLVQESQRFYSPTVLDKQCPHSAAHSGKDQSFGQRSQMDTPERARQIQLLSTSRSSTSFSFRSTLHDNIVILPLMHHKNIGIPPFGQSQKIANGECA